MGIFLGVVRLGRVLGLFLVILGTATLIIVLAAPVCFPTIHKRPKTFHQEMHRAGQRFLQSGRVKKSVAFLYPKDRQEKHKQNWRNNPIHSSLKISNPKILSQRI